jgi:predicted DNA-binding protein
MNTQQAQIKVNLPLPLKEYLESRADKFGMPLAGYIKHLILKDVSDMDYPTYQASERTEEAYKNAVKERAHAVKVTGNIDTFLENL